MNRHLQCHLHHHLLAAAAAAVLLAAVAPAQAGGITRDQVRAELAEARALGLLDRPGEAGATDAVLQARERYNETQTRVLIARRDLEQRRLAEAEASVEQRPLMPEQVVVLEAGRDGPVAVLISTAFDGSQTVVEGPLQVVAVDLD